MGKKVELTLKNDFIFCRCGHIQGNFRYLEYRDIEELEVIVYKGEVYVTFNAAHYKEILAPVKETLEEIKKMIDVKVTYYDKQDKT